MSHLLGCNSCLPTSVGGLRTYKFATLKLQVYEKYKKDNMKKITKSLREKCYGVISGPCFPVFRLNTGKYGPEITPYLDTFHAVNGNIL